MIEVTEYIERRAKLMQSMGNGSIAIIQSAKEVLRNGPDNVFSFRQNSDFFYLTGFNEPEAVAVLIPGRADGEFILFNRPRDRAKEIWTGKRLGQAGAQQELAADQAFDIAEFENKLPELLADRELLFAAFGRAKQFDDLVFNALDKVKAKVRTGVNAPAKFQNIESIVHEMRWQKSAAEIAVMRKVSEISAQAHARAMRECKNCETENQLEAELMHEFIRHGARYAAYNAIVGGGANSCILHYNDNNQQLNSGELVLIDAGAELNNYAADITRTFPVSGKFNNEQRAIYELVLKANQVGIEQVKPGAEWPAIQTAIIEVITAGLVELGLLQGEVSELIEQEAYKDFYMHNSGHWIGLDVHDVGAYKTAGQWRKLAVGNALTVEPGIYISADLDGVDPKWHNIGVRIEDDIVVTENGCEVLTTSVPKAVAEIEALMA